jgi:hypothetical protein
MVRHLKRGALVAVVLAAVSACGNGDEEDEASRLKRERCGRIGRAACASLVRCRAGVGSTGKVFTVGLCAEAEPSLASQCASDPATAAVGTASEAQIAACVSAFEAAPCSSICNQVPQDPAECRALDPTPNEDFISCAP